MLTAGMRAITQIDFCLFCFGFCSSSHSCVEGFSLMYSKHDLFGSLNRYN